jgi:tetratricopeptide (TPR) repeat protein
VKTSGGKLVLTLDSGVSSWGEHGLGRFRLSVTDDPEVLNRVRNRSDFNEREIVELSFALAKAYAQQNRLAEAVHALQKALELASDRSGKAKVITYAATLEDALKGLAASAAGDRLFLTELARHYSEQQQTALAAAVRTQARTLIERQLTKEPENAELATELADLLLQDTTAWTVLSPNQVGSKSGVSLAVQSDGSRTSSETRK